MFTEFLFRVAAKWKQHKYLSTDEWMDKYIWHTTEYISATEKKHISAIEKKHLLIHVATWILSFKIKKPINNCVWSIHVKFYSKQSYSDRTQMSCVLIVTEARGDGNVLYLEGKNQYEVHK